MSVLVTGGAGFIGSNFVRNANNELGDRIVVLDKLTYAGNLSNIHGLIDDKNLIFVKGDIANKACVESVFSKYEIDTVFNFAAESHVDRSILGAEEFIQTNILGTFTLLEVARHFWKDSQGRFVHVSTDEVFGELTDDVSKFHENTPYDPRSPYSASKAGSDHLVRAWSNTYGLPTIVTNCSNNYGPYQFPEKLIPLVVMNILENRALPVYGDGQQIRDWIYVMDHCDGLFKALSKGQPGETYLFGGEAERTNLQVVETICETMDKVAGTKDSKSLIEFVKDRPGHDRRYAIDIKKSNKELGWSPAHRFEESLESTICWYLEHKGWCENVMGGEYRKFYETQYSKN